MCKKLVYFLLLCLCLCTSFSCQTKMESTEAKRMEMKSIPFLDCAESKEAILAWGEQLGDFPCRVYEYTYEDKHAIVLLRTVGYGFLCDHFYIFIKSAKMNHWRFVLARHTASPYSEVKIYQDNDRLIFKTVEGDVILEQSFDALLL